MASEVSGPLAGIRVIEFGNLIAGPYCAMLLADLGADVVKVEHPNGDLARAFGPYVDGVSYYFAAINRGKRSIAVNPRHTEAAPWIRKLCLGADVIVNNLRYGAMSRAGLGYENLRDDNPGVVYAEVSAFGNTGPDAERAGIDILFQGESGMMSITGAEGDPPMKTATTVGDFLAGTNAALAISAALAGRATTGRGRRVDVSLRDGLIAIQSAWNAMFFADGRQPGRIGTASWFTGPTGTFETRDGYLNIAIVSDRHFELFCDVMGLDIASDPRFASNELRVANRATLHDLVGEITATATTDEWMARLLEVGLPVGRLKTIPETFDDPQVRHNQMRVELPHPQLGTVPVTGSPMRIDGNESISRGAPPELGEHTAQVLGQLGASHAEIEALVAAGAVRLP